MKSIAIVSFVAAILLVACTSEDTPTASPIPGGVTVSVTTTELRFAPTELRRVAGEVKLTVRNDGLQAHDLTVPALGIHLIARSSAGHRRTAGSATRLVRRLSLGRWRQGEDVSRWSRSVTG